MRVFRSVCLCLGAALNNEMRRFKARSGAFVASGIEANEVAKQVSSVRPAGHGGYQRRQRPTEK